MIGILMKRSILKVILTIIVVINLTEAVKLGLLGAGLLLNSITKSMLLPLPVPLPIQIIYGPGPSVIQPKTQFYPVAHPIPVRIPIHVNIPDAHREMSRRMDPMSAPPFNPYCNYITLSNGDSKVISREPLPTTIKGRTVVRYCQQPVPNINSGKYQVVFKGNRKSSFGSIRVSIKM